MATGHETDTLRQGPSYQTKLGLARNSFRWRGSNSYEALPLSIGSEGKLWKLKKKLNIWIRQTLVFER